MNLSQTNYSLNNESCSVAVDLNGGCITSFVLNEVNINPLNFVMERLVPENENLEKNFYKGHFLCLGRWGDPSPGELANSIVKHGDISLVPWNLDCSTSTSLSMQARSLLEGLSIKRELILDNDNASFLVKEQITNTGKLSRLFNIVQHPTIAAPFLNKSTIVDCNALAGFCNAVKDVKYSKQSQWPHAIRQDGRKVNIRRLLRPSSGVFSFVVDKKSTIGWISAYSPVHNFLIAYVWQRKYFPWINMWIHTENDEIKYRGLEFGTTCVHVPFKEIAEKNLWNVLDEKTSLLIDAGNEMYFEYVCLLVSVPAGFKGINDIRRAPNGFQLTENRTGRNFIVESTLNFP